MNEKTNESIKPETNQEFISGANLLTTIVIGIYLIVFFVLSLYFLIYFWPISSQKVFSLFGREISNEVPLILVVTLSGALGKLIHSFRSFYWYVGHRKLVRSWLWQYILSPFIGAALAIAFYFVIRGGLFSPGASITDTRPFGFAALAVLVGMFSDQAVLKLKDVADTLLTKPKPGANAVPEEKETR